MNSPLNKAPKKEKNLNRIRREEIELVRWIEEEYNPDTEKENS